MNRNYLRLTDLPQDVIFAIFQYCDLRSLLRLARTCKKFARIIREEDCVWKGCSTGVFGSNMASPKMRNRCKPIFSYKRRCEISKMWRTQLGIIVNVITYKKCIPWCVLEKDYVYLSRGKAIVQYQRTDEGNVFAHSYKKVVPCADDVAKFALNDEEIVCGGRDGKLTLINKHSMTVIHSETAHEADILTVDTKKDIIVSGSKDCSLKIWKSFSGRIKCKQQIIIGNRVLSTSILPSNNLVVVGTPGTRGVHPIQVLDLESGACLAKYGIQLRDGAGILDIFPETSNTFYTCGYDTMLKLWDMRCPRDNVAVWIEPFDSALYCVQTDYNVTILTGTCRSACFNLWDKRVTRRPITNYYLVENRNSGEMRMESFSERDYFTEPGVMKVDPYTQRYYVAEKPISKRGTFRSINSPVYSLAFDAAHTFLTYDKHFLQTTFV